jgi:hypothetical protein
LGFALLHITTNHQLMNQFCESEVPFESKYWMTLVEMLLVLNAHGFYNYKKGKKDIIIYMHDNSRWLIKFIFKFIFCYFILFYHHIDLFQFLIIILNWCIHFLLDKSFNSHIRNTNTIQKFHNINAMDMKSHITLFISILMGRH